MWPPPVRALLYDVRSAVGTALGARLRGLYLYGSLVTGDFDSETSDVDLLAVTDGPLDAAELARLDAVHSVLVERHPAWLDRIEIAYIAAAARTTPSRAASPPPSDPSAGTSARRQQVRHRVYEPSSSCPVGHVRHPVLATQ